MIQSSHRGYLEGVVGPSVVDVVAEAGEEESQHLKVRQEGEVVAALVQYVAEVGHGEGVVPVMIGWIPVATLHHQHKPYMYTYAAIKEYIHHYTYSVRVQINY